MKKVGGLSFWINSFIYLINYKNLLSPISKKPVQPTNAIKQTKTSKNQTILNSLKQSLIVSILNVSKLCGFQGKDWKKAAGFKPLLELHTEIHNYTCQCIGFSQKDTVMQF